MQQLLTVRKVLWGVKNAALREGMQRKTSDLDRFIVHSKQQEIGAAHNQSVKDCLIL